jgi:hypothetical protein
LICQTCHTRHVCVPVPNKYQYCSDLHCICVVDLDLEEWLCCRSWLYCQCLLVRITTNVVSLNPAHDDVYSIQHFLIKFVNDLWQVGVFFSVTLVSSTNKTDYHGIAEILLKVAVCLFIAYRLPINRLVEKQYRLSIDMVVNRLLRVLIFF